MLVGRFWTTKMKIEIKAVLTAIQAEETKEENKEVKEVSA